MTEEQRDWIDNASYEDLLRRWRFAPVGDPIFQGEAGEYYMTVMNARRLGAGEEAHTRISKKIGW